MSVIASALLDLLARASGDTLDAIALEGVVPAALIAQDESLARASHDALRDAVDAWFEAEASGWTFADVMVFAAAVDTYPAAQVIAVRPAQGSDSLVVTVRCPHAALHASYARRYGLHHHGVRAGVKPDPDGSLGLRHPHCGELAAGLDHLDLPQYELVVPPVLRGVFE